MPKDFSDPLTAITRNGIANFHWKLIFPNPQGMSGMEKESREAVKSGEAFI
ncbi:MAG: hypothetical protein GF388_04520 [Candidatus Aegiribacteria sp.]|nr:hypothetical protein [Candidatus Aegiribacteria sp.]MBD3294500.1 hypothetical protein [Candidatus Fermentibacteria bacterium]